MDHTHKKKTLKNKHMATMWFLCWDDKTNPESTQHANESALQISQESRAVTCESDCKHGRQGGKTKRVQKIPLCACGAGDNDSSVAVTPERRSSPAWFSSSRPCAVGPSSSLSSLRWGRSRNTVGQTHLHRYATGRVQFTRVGTL